MSELEESIAAPYLAEIDALKQWKESATNILNEWDKVSYELGGVTVDDLGKSASQVALREAKRLKSRSEPEGYVDYASQQRRERIATACLAGLLANGEVVKACFINRGSVTEMIDDLTVKAIHAADGLIYCLGTPTKQE